MKYLIMMIPLIIYLYWLNCEKHKREEFEKRSKIFDYDKEIIDNEK